MSSSICMWWKSCFWALSWAVWYIKLSLTDGLKPPGRGESGSFLYFCLFVCHVSVVLSCQYRTWVSNRPIVHIGKWLAGRMRRPYAMTYVSKGGEGLVPEVCRVEFTRVISICKWDVSSRQWQMAVQCQWRPVVKWKVKRLLQQHMSLICDERMSFSTVELVCSVLDWTILLHWGLCWARTFSSSPVSCAYVY